MPPAQPAQVDQQVVQAGQAGSVLERIVADTRARVAARRRLTAYEALAEQARARGPARDFAAALRAPGLGVIAEIKRGSPSKGLFAPDLDPAALARTFERIGAAAVSVLTAPDFFASDDDLHAAAASLRDASLPILRKEFHVDPYQIAEARALGADAFLIIAKSSSSAEMHRLIEAGRGLGITAFVEITDEAELAAALDVGAPAIGINNRDLHTFKEDLSTTERLRPLVPAGIPVAAASGVRTRADMQRMQACGVDAVLIGEALSSAADPAAKLRELAGQ